jgi:hypothetical protein
MIRAELTCCGITRGAICDIGAVIRGGEVMAAAGVNMEQHSINPKATSGNTPNGKDTPTAMATAYQ